MVPLCRHIMPSNKRCGSPAVNGQLYCYHHKTVKTATKRPPRRPNDFTYIIPFAFAEDRAAIQVNLHLVNRALMEGRIDARAANTYNNNIRIALSNLRLGPLNEEDHENSIQRVILTPEGDEIATPRELLEKDESPVHYKDCPCRRCAEQFRGAPPEQHHADCKCGVCDETSHQPSAVSDQKETSDQPSAVSDQSADGPAVRVARVEAFQAADKLDPLQRQPSFRDYLYGDEIRKHEAQHAARTRAALEAGLEPPPYQPWDRSTHEDKWDREDREWREEIDRNRKEAIDSWNRENPDQPKEFKPYLTWGEEHDLKLAQMKKLREEEKARLREQSLPASSADAKLPSCGLTSHNDGQAV